MFENYKSRMASKGENVSEMLRNQSNDVIEQTWTNDPNYRRVYVVSVDSGLPTVTSNMETLDAKFNVKTSQSITADEVSFLLQFRSGAERTHPEIAVGSYVYIQDEDGVWKWWMICHYDESPQFRQYQILECNWTFGWVTNGKIYHCLGIQRVQGNSNSGSWDGERVSLVNNITSAWMPTNNDTLTIGYNHRFIISDIRRRPPLVWTVSKIEDAQPGGMTKFKFTQETFDPTKDNAELALCNYYDTQIVPVAVETPTEVEDFSITYNGKKPTIKVGGSAKVFTAQLPSDNLTDIKWSIFDGVNTYGTNSYENYTGCIFGDYVVSVDDRTLSIKANRDYDLVGKILIISAECSDGSMGSVKVEVIG